MAKKNIAETQSILSRMADNAFKTKSWALTIVPAVWAIGNTVPWFLAIILFIFWCLDGFFLSQERSFRELTDDDWPYQNRVPESPFKTMWRPTVWVIYLPLILIVIYENIKNLTIIYDNSAPLNYIIQ